MKNIYKTAVCVALIAGLSGCTGGTSNTPTPKAPVEAAAPDSKYAKEFVGAPSWVISPPSEGGLAAVGIYKIGKAGIPMAKKQAISRAKAELAGALKSKVKGFTEDFMRETGIADDNQAVESMASSASKVMSQATLEGTRFKTAWISSTGNYYALVVMDGNRFRAKAKSAIKTSMKDKEKLYQQFVAKQGFEKMDKELGKAFKDFKAE